MLCLQLEGHHIFATNNDILCKFQISMVSHLSKDKINDLVTKNTLSNATLNEAYNIANVKQLGITYNVIFVHCTPKLDLPNT